MNYIKIVLILLIFGSTALNSQQQGVPQGQNPAAIAKQAEMQSPGPEHNLLYAMEGIWRQLVSWHTKGQPDEFSKGFTQNRVILGGRYLQMKSIHDIGIFPYLSMTMIGFDRRIEKYTLHIFDVLTTYSLEAEGKYDPENQVLTFRGSSVPPMAEKELPFSYEITFEDDNKFIIKLFVHQNDEIFLRMKVVNIKKKDISDEKIEWIETE